MRFGDTRVPNLGQDLPRRGEARRQGGEEASCPAKAEAEAATRRSNVARVVGGTDTYAPVY